MCKQILSDRRSFILAGSAMAAALAFPRRAESGLRSEDVIDIHHHVLPPAYLKMNAQEVAKRSTGYTQVLEWTPERSLAEMQSAGVRTAVLSMSAPIWFGNKEQTRDLARASNEFMRELAAAHPGRFAFFATLPLPDVDASILEARDALGRKAVGVCLLSNYDDIYLGDAKFVPLLEELDRLGAVAYVHPTNASCCRSLTPDIPAAFLELPFDTTRTIASLLYAGAFSRYRRIRFVFSHGGGTIAFLADRLCQWVKARPDLAARLPEGPMAELQRLNFDTASITNGPAMSALMAMVNPAQIMFGSDYPYVSATPQLAELVDRKLRPNVFAGICHSNAERLMPDLRPH